MNVYLGLIASVFFWGATWVSGRYVAQQMTPFPAAFLRFFFAAMFLVPAYCRLEGGRRLPRLPKNMVLPAAFLGLTGIFGYNYCFFSGLHTISGSRAALIIAATPVVICVFSALLHGERFGPLRVAGVLLSFSGVAMVVSGGAPLAVLSRGIAVGDLYIFACVLCWTAYTMAGASVMKHLSPLATVTWSCLFGALFLLPAALMDGLLPQAAAASFTVWANLAFLGVVATGIAFSLYYAGIRSLGASRAGIFINLVPVFAMLLGWAILDETIGGALLLGACMILSGVWLTNRGKAPAPPRVPQPATE